jgi:hypothetical protein
MTKILFIIKLKFPDPDEKNRTIFCKCNKKNRTKLPMINAKKKNDTVIVKCILQHNNSLHTRQQYRIETESKSEHLLSWKQFHNGIGYITLDGILRIVHFFPISIQ